MMRVSSSDDGRPARGVAGRLGAAFLVVARFGALFFGAGRLGAFFLVVARFVAVFFGAGRLLAIVNTV